ncbi:WD40 repeat domain-containing protein [Streptomyces ochraceiscleroticus]|uniref:WD40 repeat domain-containing protein n=1 Tax=Streptomyces ochraceiscleroticus TaxID=47761 RepID=A0ABW1MKI9_9ACTN|nr:hypothetical protein [Streptomyces ochraceiscleroticus]
MWTLADQLQTVARAPGELLQVLAADARPTTIVLADLHTAADAPRVAELVLALLRLPHVRLVVEARSGGPTADLLKAAGTAVMDLDQAQWTDPDRHAAWRAAHPADSPGPPPPASAPALPLGDPTAVCTADPMQVTRGFENSEEPHGGLRAAWLRAGQSLCRDQDPAMRALVLLTALGHDADPRLEAELTEKAEPTRWGVLWHRARGDTKPPWPGPALALATGRGALQDNLVVADHQGTMRTVATGDAAPTGRLSMPVTGAVAITNLQDGTVLALNGQGRVHAQRSSAARRPLGLKALNEGPTAEEQLTAALRAHTADVPASALTAAGTIAATGNAAGRVHVFAQDAPDAPPGTARLHEGPVTALTALELPASGSGQPIALLYSGGMDGLVRVWGPTAEPLDLPLVARPCPVTALDSAYTTTGPTLAVAWADGLVEYHSPETGELRTLRPGPPVNALTVSPTGHLVIGTDETLTCLRPR